MDFFCIPCSKLWGKKKNKTNVKIIFVNSMMQRTGQNVIKVVNKNSHAEVWQKSSSYSNLAVKLISIKQKSKHRFIILSGRTRQGNLFQFLTSINRNFATLMETGLAHQSSFWAADTNPRAMVRFADGATVIFSSVCNYSNDTIYTVKILLWPLKQGCRFSCFSEHHTCWFLQRYAPLSTRHTMTLEIRQDTI